MRAARALFCQRLRPVASPPSSHSIATLRAARAAPCPRPAPRSPRAARVATMAGTGPNGETLDKATSEETWKKLLSAEEVRSVIGAVGGWRAADAPRAVVKPPSPCGATGPTCFDPTRWVRMPELHTDHFFCVNQKLSQYYVLRQKGTEPPGSGPLNKNFADGTYTCAGCGSPLFTSDMKFDSGCGWPAFFDEIPGSIDRHVDNSMGMARTEITCAKCGGHLGHVFVGERFNNPKDQRHCVNSISIKFTPK